jgi:hypothetical protein
MKNFDTRVYSIADFEEWDNSGLLNISPDFQRRSVWSEKAKSYLIDTIIRGLPIPKILISQELRGGRVVRIVVDGQQRLRAILGFINGDFKISRAHNREFAGRTFDTLPPGLQDDFRQYELGVDLLFDMSYEQILDIFTRINAYTVTLVRQERFNARFLGFFKQAAYQCGQQYARYFIEGGVMTKRQVTRMKEAELAGDLLVAIIAGVQTNKNLDQYYKRYEDEDEEGEVELAASRFDEVMSYVGGIYPPEELSTTNWARIHLFYTFFTAIAHLLVIPTDS